MSVAVADPAVEAWAEAKPAVRARVRWEIIARANQIPPEDMDWFICLMLAGRGWGKSRSGAEWIADKSRRYPGCRNALVAQTFSDGRDTMVEGESGLLSVLESEELRGGDRDEAWNRSMGELYLANGSRFKVFSSEKPHRLRGPQHHFAWADEPATFHDAHKGPSEDTTWANLEIGCRLTIDGSEPQIVATGTPKPVKLLTETDREPKGLVHRDSTVIIRGHTDENLANLASTYRRRVVEPLRGTRLGRQELAAEILGEVEGALWKREWIEDHRVGRGPEKGYQAMVLGLDPSDGSETGAEQGMCLAGLGLDQWLYVVSSKGVRATPREWLREAVLLARDNRAVIVVEKNHGGQFLIDLLEQVMREAGVRVPYRVISASTGKRTRAEPVAMLYEQGKVRTIRTQAKLEDQMTSFTGAPGEKSPDVLDAAVWALSELMGYGGGPRSSANGKAVPYKANGKGAVAYR